MWKNWLKSVQAFQAGAAPLSSNQSDSRLIWKPVVVNIEEMPCKHWLLRCFYKDIGV